MASLLLDKLEALKSDEIKLKEEQRFLEKQIALEMEKKRRLLVLLENLILQKVMIYLVKQY